MLAVISSPHGFEIVLMDVATLSQAHLIQPGKSLLSRVLTATRATSCRTKIVNANHTWNALRTGGLADEAAKQGGATGRKLHLRSKTHTCLTASDCCHAAQKLCHRLSTTLVAVGKRGEVFSKRLTGTSKVGAAKASPLDEKNHCLARTGKAVDAARKPTMPCLRVGLTYGTLIAFASRNQRDCHVLALLLD
jgi:hypothetical protein